MSNKALYLILAWTVLIIILTILDMLNPLQLTNNVKLLSLKASITLISKMINRPAKRTDYLDGVKSIVTTIMIYQHHLFIRLPLLSDRSMILEYYLWAGAELNFVMAGYLFAGSFCRFTSQSNLRIKDWLRFYFLKIWRPYLLLQLSKLITFIYYSKSYWFSQARIPYPSISLWSLLLNIMCLDHILPPSDRVSSYHVYYI